jgi:putative oxidoreductase
MKTMSYIQDRSPTWRNIPIDLISRSPIARWAPIPLRLIVGYGFMEHGFAKLARGPDAFPAILQALGVPAPHLMGWLTIFVEIVGGLAVLLGALVPLASIPMAAVLLVATSSRCSACGNGLRLDWHIGQRPKQRSPHCSATG